MLLVLHNVLNVLGRDGLVAGQDHVAKLDLLSFFYVKHDVLVPAALFALQNNTRVVISTNTINLQDQIIRKDIPDLAAALGLDLRAAVAEATSQRSMKALIVPANASITPTAESGSDAMIATGCRKLPNCDASTR